MNIAFPPPLQWQDFEDLTLQVARNVFEDPGAQCNGRTGQAQAGVDVYCREHGNGRQIGVQCKRRGNSDARPGASVTIDEIKTELEYSSSFQPKLEYFILATTGSRDANLQWAIRNLQQERILANKYPFTIWFWEDFVGFLNNDSQLAKAYTTVLQASFGDSVGTRQILSVVRTAFSRAAFRTPLQYESPGEFRQALLDTERAVNTGLLLDRETRMPICRASGGLSQVTNDPNGQIPVLLEAVRKARILYDACVADGRIRVCGNCLAFPEPTIREQLDRLRYEAIIALNSLLADHGEPVVESPLLDHPFANPRKPRAG